jgi:general secretion pathway protein A
VLLNYHNLTEQPFGVTPDPRYLYLGAQHREALASLVYTTQSDRGFVAMIAKPGMGKTSLLYHYLAQLRYHARTSFVFRTDCNSREFLRYVLLDLGLDAPLNDLPAMHEALDRVLTEELRANRRFVLVIDEAQNLSESVLESIRLLSNFETPGMKCMQIVLAGQPQLADKLAKPSMIQLRQRISQIIRIEPLTPEEVSAYIDCRLGAVGCRNLALFTASARSSIAEYSEGIPRNINNICFNALSIACAMNRKVVDNHMVAEVMTDLSLNSQAAGGTVVSRRLESKMSRASESRTQPEKRKRPGRWVPTFALSASLIAVLSLAASVNVTGPRTAGPETTVGLGQSDSASSVLPARAASPMPSDPNQSASPLPGSALVSSGQTIYGISRATFGRYDEEVLSEIKRLNPWLIDPKRIPAGQRILLPRSITSSNHSQQRATQMNVSALPKKAQ